MKSFKVLSVLVCLIALHSEGAQASDVVAAGSLDERIEAIAGSRLLTDAAARLGRFADAVEDSLDRFEEHFESSMPCTECFPETQNTFVVHGIQ